MCPLVSICIGAYNRKDYIRECVDSALAQTWLNKEVVVVSAASRVFSEKQGVMS